MIAAFQKTHFGICQTKENSVTCVVTSIARLCLVLSNIQNKLFNFFVVLFLAKFVFKQQVSHLHHVCGLLCFYVAMLVAKGLCVLFAPKQTGYLSKSSSQSYGGYRVTDKLMLQSFLVKLFPHNSIKFLSENVTQ